MRKEILYVELKKGHSGLAWIGYGYFSKSGQTVYFDGKVLKKGRVKTYLMMNSKKFLNIITT
jgi:hypothetical protein